MSTCFLVRVWKSVDFPTFGSPTMPIDNAIMFLVYISSLRLIQGRKNNNRDNGDRYTDLLVGFYPFPIDKNAQQDRENNIALADGNGNGNGYEYGGVGVKDPRRVIKYAHKGNVQTPSPLPREEVCQFPSHDEPQKRKSTMDYIDRPDCK